MCEQVVAAGVHDGVSRVVGAEDPVVAGIGQEELDVALCARALGVRVG